jgi:hypothetical protein
MVHWIPNDLFSRIDTPENAIFLNQEAHGYFERFIEMEDMN